MRFLVLILGLVFILWGIWDCVTGTSTSGGRFHLPTPYSAKQLGPFFYLIAILKIAVGLYAIGLTLYQFFKKL
ncbi:MAG: hypothetical protein N3G78_06935 [Desulfobacterota bacterium]|nr:hypothetical protein [Thermodesulfobacteriota bacterium]